MENNKVNQSNPRGEVAVVDEKTLNFHLQEVLAGKRRFETAAQAVSRMILEKTEERPEPVKKIMRCGKTIYDYQFFREGKKHIVAWYDEINALVHFIKNAAEGGSANEMAIVFIGQPGNGKTFFINYLCEKYRIFLSRPGNTRYTFKFVGLDNALGYHPKVAELPSMTFEDPMILAMNSHLYPNFKESKEYLAKIGFKDNAIEKLYEQRRPLGASTEYLWSKLLEKCGSVEKALEHVRIMPVPLMESMGTVTGKYQAKDKITASGVDLNGEEGMQYLLYLPLDDPNRFDLRRGALARVACGGVHFSDEIFKNKPDLVQIYLGVVQEKKIDVDAFSWPIDTLIIATSNNEEYNKFHSQPEQTPITDRCRKIYVGHNTDYKLQGDLTFYALGGGEKTTVTGESMHIDPLLIPTISYIAVLTRLLKDGSEKLTSIEMMKLEAGEVAGDKAPEALQEIKDKANAKPDVSKRWGHTGLGQRDVGRILQILGEMEISNEGRCMCALDAFPAAERVILDDVTESTDRDKYMQDQEVTARKLYRELVKTAVYNAFMEDSQAVEKAVMAYVTMIIGIGSTGLGKGKKVWQYRDANGEIKSLDIDEKYIDAVERRLGLNNREAKEAFRIRIRNLYAQKIPLDPKYNYMDEQKLVKAVTEVRTESDMNASGSLMGALGNLNNEENRITRDRMLTMMTGKLGFCKTCAQRTIQYYVEGRKDD